MSYSDLSPAQTAWFEGLKLPTAVHDVIARLAAGGFVKVIITTNFDRLSEQALENVGVDHDVVVSTDAITGAGPLVHSPCLVSKLHGDYRDARIRSTVGELEKHDDPVNALLDQVLDNHGLIVCGWFATWDPALRRAIVRHPNRCYGYYWTTRGDMLEGAGEIVDHRLARRRYPALRTMYRAGLPRYTRATTEHSDPAHP